MFLGSKEIERLIKEEDLVKYYVNFDDQLQPDGFDLTIRSIEKFVSCSEIYTDNKKLAHKDEVVPLPFATDFGIRECWNLPQGVYIIHFNEEVKMPKNVSGISIQRSTLMRSGCFVTVGAWDCGYNGSGYSALNVVNPHGLMLEKNAKVVKLQFFDVGEGKTYNGSYQGENIKNKTA